MIESSPLRIFISTAPGNVIEILHEICCPHTSYTNTPSLQNQLFRSCTYPEREVRFPSNHRPNERSIRTVHPIFYNPYEGRSGISRRKREQNQERKTNDVQCPPIFSFPLAASKQTTTRKVPPSLSFLTPSYSHSTTTPPQSASSPSPDAA